jgi:hypothetical protein
MLLWRIGCFGEWVVVENRVFCRIGCYGEWGVVENRVLWKIGRCGEYGVVRIGVLRIIFALAGDDVTGEWGNFILLSIMICTAHHISFG